MANEVGAALAAYGIGNAELKPLPSISNRVWRVISDSGEYALRITARARETDLARLAAECQWLRAIGNETDLRAPQPVRTCGGEDFARIGAGHCATLFPWLPGEPLVTADMNRETLRELGRFTARLHEHSATFRPAPPFRPADLRADALFSPASPYLSAEAPALPAETRALIDEIAIRFRAAFALLNEDRRHTGMIHGDLVAKNWLRGPAGLSLIDFDHCGRGHFLYDLAAICIQLLDEQDFPRRRAALLAAYQSERELPAAGDAELDICIVARYSASCLWLARESRRPSFAATARAAIAFRSEQIRRYLRSGRLPERGALF